MADQWSIKEHDTNAPTYQPNFTFSTTTVSGTPYFSSYSDTASIGYSHIFRVFAKKYLQNLGVDKIRLSFSISSSGYIGFSLDVTDGSYDRTSSIDFPTGSSYIAKGGGSLASSYSTNATAPAWTTMTTPSIIYGSSTQQYITIFVNHGDSWLAQYQNFIIQKIESDSEPGEDASWRLMFELDKNGIITRVEDTVEQIYNFLILVSFKFGSLYIKLKLGLVGFEPTTKPL